MQSASVDCRPGSSGPGKNRKIPRPGPFRPQVKPFRRLVESVQPQKIREDLHPRQLQSPCAKRALRAQGLGPGRVREEEATAPAESQGRRGPMFLDRWLRRGLLLIVGCAVSVWRFCFIFFSAFRLSPFMGRQIVSLRRHDLSPPRPGYWLTAQEMPAGGSYSRQPVRSPLAFRALGAA